MSGSIHWRIDHQGTHDLQIEIGPDTTVGEVAAALAADVSPAGHPPRPVGGNVPPDAAAPLTLATAGRVIHPGRAAHEAAPRSGSTVRLHRFDGEARPDLDGVEAPVVLRRGPATRRLCFGANAVHPGVVVEVAHDVRVRARGADPVVLDGVTVHGEAVVPHGGLLRLGEWTASVEVHGDLRPPPRSGPWRTHAPRRGPWPSPPGGRVELPAPPDPGRLPGLPWLSMAVPLAMAVAIWAASGSLLWSGFMAVSVGYVVAAAIESRHEARAERRFRTARFRRELARVEEELSRLSAEEHERDQLRHPEVDELLGWFDPVCPRVWERVAGHPAPLTVRLGTAALPADTEVATPGGPVTPAELQQLADRHHRHRRAAVVDLAAGGGLAIIGEATQTERLLDAVLLQLAVLVPPECVRLWRRPAATGPGRWTDWLPHRRPGAAATVQVLEDHDAGSHPVAEGELLIWRAPTTAGLPGSIGAVVHLHPQGAAELCVGHGPPLEVDLELLDPASAEPAARQLSGLALGEVRLPVPATLGGIGLPLSDDQVRRRWAPGGSWSDRRALSAPVGIVPAGGVVHLDLVADGPHCLVGGTTGSGKSELLVTWVAGLAALHPPSRLQVLLVDYKGGTSFGPLHRLPHCAGLVTDLTPQLAERALTGMRAELRRRERQVGSAGAGDVTDLAPAEAPPSLVVVIDEFATLLDELPEFVDGVLDIARRGRSLGIHLVMATQRPAGVISDAIRANTSLRIALRLPDEDDSCDVLGTPEAARLPRDLPGRALVRFAHDRLRAVQVAHGGATATATSPARVRPLRDHGPRPPGGDAHRGPAEIDLLVDACVQAAGRLGLPVAEAPWCAPLPPQLELPTGPPPDAPTGTVVLGLTDVPEEQRHGHLAVELLRSGGVLAVGAPGSGTSTTLLSLAVTASAAGWRVEAIDGGGGLRRLGAVPADDHELVHRLLRSLHDHGGGPPTLLLVDDLAAFELAQRGVNRGEAMELLARLATCAPNRRLALGVSARRRGDVPHELLHALGDRLVHRCHDLEAAMAWDAPGWLADPELPPGRIAHRGRAAQVARCSGGLPQLAPPPRLPSRLSLGDVPYDDGNDGADPTGPLRLTIGLDAASLVPAVVDLGDHHLLVAGGPRSGKSTALATLATTAARRGLPTAAPVGPGELRRLLGDVRTGAVRPPALVLVDDVETWGADPEAEAALREVLGLAAERPLRLVVAGDATALWQSHSAVIDRLRAGRCGLVLGDDAHDHDALLHTQLARRDDLQLSAGRGWLVWRGVARLVQVAVG